MKGSVSLDPKFSSLNIKNVKVIKLNPLVACDQKYLYFKGLGKDDIIKSVRWEDKAVINCTYLKKYKILLALCQNYRVYALTQNLQQITNITGWQSKYSLAFQFIEEYSILLMIGAECIEIMKVSIDTNIKKTKFLSSMKFTMRKLTTQPKIANVDLPWNKGYDVNYSQNLLYVWSPDSISFIQLSTMQVLSQSHSLTKKQNPITCIFFSSAFKYTLVGTAYGQTRVWRLPLSKKFHHQNVLIHTFESNAKSIKQIVQSRYSQKIIMTSGQDLLVCVWSLETFQMLRRFQFLGIYSQIHVKNIDEAYVVKQNFLGELNFGQSLQFITEVNSGILMIDKQNIKGSLGSVSLTLQQNLGVVLQSQHLLKAKDLNKMQMKYVYPPLKAKSIKQIISSPFSETTYYLLAQNGQLFRVNVPLFESQYIGVSSKIQEIYNVEFVCDKQKHPLNQLPSCIRFLQCLPLQFDSQIRDADQSGNKSFRSENQKHGLSKSQAIQKYNKLKLMAIGCEKGSVIFLSGQNMKKIYCRLTYHREKILFVECLKQNKSLDFNPKDGIVASFCEQKYLKLVRFDYQKSSANCFLTYYAGQQLKNLQCFDNHLITVFYKGQFQICQLGMMGKNEELCCKRSSVVQNHEGQILNIDYQHSHELILSTGTDNKIKIWTVIKILLYEILLDNGLSYAFFIPHKIQKKQMNFIQNFQDNSETQDNNLRKEKSEKNQNVSSDPIQAKIKELMKRPRPKPVNFDMIILHAEKLLYFHHIPLSFRPNQIQDFNTNPQLIDDQKASLRQVFQNYSQKPIQVDFQKNKTHKKQQFKSKTKQRQRISTEPNHQVNLKKFFTEQSKVISNQSNQNNNLYSKNMHFKTEASRQKAFESPKILEPLVIRTQKKKQKKVVSVSDRQSISTYKSILDKPGLISQSSIQATKKHLKEISTLKHQINVNRPFLPKLASKKEDIFDQFMRQKLINKSVLTRRDITINRIIMKNIIKEHFQEESKMIGLRLDR